MRVTVIPSDRWIRVDGRSAVLPVWPFDDSHIHAIQWRNGAGEIEFTGTPKPQNQPTDDPAFLTPYVEALDAFLAAEQQQAAAATTSEMAAPGPDGASV